MVEIENNLFTTESFNMWDIDLSSSNLKIKIIIYIMIFLEVLLLNHISIDQGFTFNDQIIYVHTK